VRNKVIVPVFVLLAGTMAAQGQGMVSDLMSGKLIDPEVGVFAWYTLTDSASDREYFLRQAVVGEEKVGRKAAHWLETELVPKVGFPSVYKMLLTGPAEDPRNVHRLVVREGQGAPEEVEIDRSLKPDEGEVTPRSASGTVVLTVAGEEIATEHYVIESNGEKTEIWVSDQVRPMGLVRMKSPQGELMLQRYGVGGQDGKSAIPELQSPAESVEKRETQENQPRTNFGGRRGRR